ncbi:hypothetical protein E2542_SST02492 [Spatholobus suberectus]|nr:hypothetical protein E2542_SST02492 [Spatholobus suberectus]
MVQTPKDVTRVETTEQSAKHPQIEFGRKLNQGATGWPEMQLRALSQMYRPHRNCTKRHRLRGPTNRVLRMEIITARMATIICKSSHNSILLHHRPHRSSTKRHHLRDQTDRIFNMEKITARMAMIDATITATLNCSPTGHTEVAGASTGMCRHQSNAMVQY